jgi:MoaA/NifB/PqqE/SkfB family radical SAM enzyme
MNAPSIIPVDRLLRKTRPEFVEVTPRSIALFRLGEQCNNDCPMCSNTGRPEAFFIPTPELLRRVDALFEQGMLRVVITGGEPTIHPGFWDVVLGLGQRGIVWDINSHGRTFAELDFAEKAREQGLERAIISLHSHEVAISALISGVKAKAHHETIAGIKNLSHVGVHVLVNFVLTTHNATEPPAFVEYCSETFGCAVDIKFAFPTTSGKGGEWDGIQLRYSDVAPAIREARQVAKDLGTKIHFESVPNCILRDAGLRNLSRSGFGETHYLEDVHGESLFSIRHIEASFSGYPPGCEECSAFENCPGVSLDYLNTFGGAEFQPFPTQG